MESEIRRKFANRIQFNASLPCQRQVVSKVGGKFKSTPDLRIRTEVARDSGIISPTIPI
jgi:hypothetical protein